MSLCSCSFTWTIHDFTDLDRTSDDFLQSPKIRGSECGGPEFSVVVRPWGFYRFQNESPEEEEHVAVYLRVHNVEGKAYDIRYGFSLLDSFWNKCCFTQDERSITMEGESCGSHNFVKREYLLHKSEMLLPGNKMTILVEVVIMNAVGGSLAAGKTIENGKPALEPIEELPKDLWRLYKSGDHADRCFIVGGTKMIAHSAILAARSPEVSKLFADGANEVVVKNIKPEVFEGILQAIYTETMIENLDERAEDLLKAADLFGLKKLKQRAESALMKQVTVQTVARLLVLSFKCDAPDLKENTLRYLIDNKKEVKGTVGWKELAKYPEIMFELFASI